MPQVLALYEPHYRASFSDYLTVLNKDSNCNLVNFLRNSGLVVEGDVVGGVVVPGTSDVVVASYCGAGDVVEVVNVASYCGAGDVVEGVGGVVVPGAGDVVEG